jgi:protein-disulfide isomerase
MNMIIAVALIALSRPACAAAPSADQIKEAISNNPEIILNVLKEHKKELYQIVSQAAQEEQEKSQKEAADKEKKDFEDSFKNPKIPSIPGPDRIRGAATAKYTVVEYSDFQCPYCARGFHTVEDLRQKYGASLRFIYKNMPLPFHPNAMPAAQYFEAVARQSPEKAWKFHDKMFQNQDKLGEQFYKDTIKDLGLNVKKAEADAKGPEVAAKIQADIDEAKNFGFSGTPGFLVNGVPIRGAYPIEQFDTIISKLDKKGS